MVEDYSQQERYESPEAEIKALEQKLEAKKRELSEKGADLPHEKEVFREVLREHVEEVRPPAPVYSASGHGVSSAKPSDDDTAKKEERKEEIRKLIELALTTTIENAVRSARGSTPYILDELHDHLVDDYYDKLIALRKIQAD